MIVDEDFREKWEKCHGVKLMKGEEDFFNIVKRGSLLCSNADIYVRECFYTDFVSEKDEPSSYMSVLYSKGEYFIVAKPLDFKNPYKPLIAMNKSGKICIFYSWDWKYFEITIP